MEKERYDYKKKIVELDKKLKILDKEIYKTCDHNWVRDYSGFNDISKFYCSKCGLRDYNMYK
tara:strand:+ start:239 stop:424 length:186 start_codon:yes stop_codon:yes gene_type:complete